MKDAGEDMDLGRARRIIRSIYDEETAVSKEHLIEVLRWLMEEYI